MLSIHSINILDYDKKKSYKIKVTPKYCRHGIILNHLNLHKKWIALSR